MSLAKLNVPGIIRLIAILVLVVVSLLLIRKISHAFDTQPKASVDSTVVLEKLKKVLKLVTVEGNYSELMEYEDYKLLDIWGLRKKAIIKVNGKVLVGFDLEKVEVDVDEKARVIRIKRLPAPQILAVDTDLSYYDIEEGVFNSFSEEELTALGTKAKHLIRTKAAENKLIEEANASLIDNLDIITLTAKAQGWEIRYPAYLNISTQH